MREPADACGSPGDDTLARAADRHLPRRWHGSGDLARPACPARIRARQTTELVRQVVNPHCRSARLYSARSGA